MFYSILFTEGLITTPALLHPCLALGLNGILLRIPKREMLTTVGQELLLDKVAGIVM